VTAIEDPAFDDADFWEEEPKPSPGPMPPARVVVIDEVGTVMDPLVPRRAEAEPGIVPVQRDHLDQGPEPEGGAVQAAPEREREGAPKKRRRLFRKGGDE
jgi:hypothetical protein